MFPFWEGIPQKTFSNLLYKWLYAESAKRKKRLLLSKMRTFGTLEQLSNIKHLALC